MSFLTLIIVISVLVFVHEFGHFFVAKKSGVRVDEFSIGFPPRLWSKKHGETTYSINLIPFGGYVKIFGENPDDESLDGPERERSFVNKNRGIQALILFAGVFMNVVFAWILLSGSFMMGSLGEARANDTGRFVLVSEVLPNSPAEKAGIKADDVILSLSDKKQSYENPSSDDLQKIIASSKGEGLIVEYKRGGKIATTTIEATNGLVPGKYAVGIAMADVAERRLPFFSALLEGAKATYNLTINTFSGTITFIKDVFGMHADLSQVSGPVGIAGYLNQARQFGVGALFSLVALISINLAVINMLPFPALDGGRILFVAIEAITRKRINPKIGNTINLIGFSLLLILMAVITYSDIAKLVK